MSLLTIFIMGHAHDDFKQPTSEKMAPKENGKCPVMQVEFLNQYTGQRFASSTTSSSQSLCLSDIRFMTCECSIHPRPRHSFSHLHMWLHHQVLAQVLSELHPATSPETSTSVAGFAKNIPRCGFRAFNIG